jgi:hypothetical protein
MAKHPKTLLEAVRYFSDEQVCINEVAAMRWPDVIFPAWGRRDRQYRMAGESEAVEVPGDRYK